MTKDRNRLWIFENFDLNPDGRASRTEYWFTVLSSAVVFLVFWFALPRWFWFWLWHGDDLMKVVFGGWFLGFVGQIWAVTVRRLHDTGRSGSWVLISLIPLVGLIILLVFLVQDSQPGPNRFGPRPKD